MFSVTKYQNNINTHLHVTGFDIESLQNPSGTYAYCSHQTAETRVLSGLITICMAVSCYLRLPMV